MRLCRKLLACLLALAGGPGAAMPATAESPVRPSWVIDPAVPGDNLPPVGRSLFDQLFAVSQGNGMAGIELPFPFAALLARLDAELAQDPTSPLPPAKRVLIPLGRSLQRTAAAPEYFAYPRVVAAVDAQPAVKSAHYLKDRLYIGYQEKSAVLEVISYNEAAGRFEFQLVKDYRAGGKAEVVHANRSLCFACHQNGAPIFSRALWDETNANPQTAALLAASRKSFYGIPPGRGIDIPYAIDNATERANAFALTQKLWREGCGEDDAPARRCRAGLFSAALRHALSAGQSWQPDAAFAQDVAGRLRSEARRRWPGGLAVGNPDLPNRNPLPDEKPWPDDAAARIAHSHVAARFDPLLLRPPREIWQAEAPGAIGALIGIMAEFISARDRQLLETALARPTKTPVSRLSLNCAAGATPAASRHALRCAPAPGERGASLSGSLTLSAGQPTGGELARLTLPDGTALNRIALRPADSSGSAFLLSRDGRPLRSATGHLISRLKLPTGSGEAVLEIRDDFIAVEQAISALADGPEAPRLFGPTAIPRQALIAALLRALGSPSPTACCRAAEALPPPRLEVPAALPGSLPSQPTAPGLQPFYPYCATCHQSAETFPPNFLSGSPAEVSARLRQCAPRLYVRLAMADLTPEQRAKTPMPPESMLPAFATDTAGWKASPARQALLAEVGQWLRAETGTAPNLTHLLANGYEALRPCLPAP